MRETHSGTVLVVDDEPDLRRTTATLLKSVGFVAREAADGETAIRTASEDPVDVILLDVSMPGLDGFEVLERIRCLNNPPIVIFVSARSKLDDRLHGLLSGAINYITKPYEPMELVAQVAAAVAQKARIDIAERVSRRDALTELGNRRAFDEALASEIGRSERYHHGMAVLMIDADNLKDVNDRHGHAAGDQLIRSIAGAIKRTCRGTDLAARLGGDEFAVLLPESDRACAESLVDRIHAQLAEERIDVGTGKVTPSVSIGFALFPDDARNAAQLMERADAELYRRKRDRKSRSDGHSARGTP